MEVTIRALQDNDFVISDCTTVDANLNVLSKSRFDEFVIKPVFLDTW